ncbi:ATP-dependent helicase HrpB [Janibacter hoylei]|uniref:ATP-dependent helicase HrpB n=1 Tax=Janibacter hoylei TaxID=364298 RepID=UPI0022378761|nr:ATP-dependent helicase HrpB [Janibacter hoylei]MCW4601520.1 ATP-dependent helicase HrpB [Janibacter hoylei]
MTDLDLRAIGEGLPFAETLDDLRAAVTTRGVAVVQAPPGSGKTTLAPPLVADCVEGRVVVTGPRRVTVRAAARRLAHLTGTQVGDLVGHTVRGERRVGPRTRVEFVTPGVLVRRLLADPELTGTAAVVLDEVHERALDTDLLLGMLAEVRQLRELPLVAMSATLDAPGIAALLGDDDGPAPLVDSEGALHPLEVLWEPSTGPRTDARGVTRDFLEHVARVTARHHEPDHHTLVFVPGAREVDQVVELLGRLVPGAEVLPLHGRLAPREQDRAIGGEPTTSGGRIVVSTDLAESSLTVPGVRLVVDAALSREPRRDAARDMSGLVTVQASRASMTQRAGRAARLGPGRAVRLVEESVWSRAPEHVTPQITTADLTETALTLAAWGSPRGEGMALLTPPPTAGIDAAETTLRGLGLVDDGGRITDDGFAATRIPADPRLARALLDGATLVGTTAAAEVVATLADDLRSDDGDLDRLLADLRSGRSRDASRWRREADRLARLVPAGEHRRPGNDARAGDRHVSGAGLVTALAHPGRIARRVGDGPAYLLASGTRAALPAGSPMGHDEWLVVADVARADGRVAAGTGAVIRLAAALTRDEAETAGAGLRVREVRADLGEGRVTAREVDALGAIEFSSTPVRADPATGADAVRRALATRGLDLLTWSPTADTLRRRLAVLHHHLGDPWPEVSDDALAARLDEWLGPELQRVATGTPFARIDLTDPLRRLLPWPEATRLDELAPERLPVPSGSTAAIIWPPHDEPSAAPVLAVKLQECFGLGETPRLLDGRVPVLFHLLSPARRLLAVTDDLASFWSGPYAQVRAEMRGRYPKHPWPEDPWTAPATARTKRRT